MSTDEEPQLQEGTEIVGNHGVYVVEKEKAASAPCIEFTIRMRRVPFAMKVEKKLENRKDPKLKMEVAILKEVLKHVGQKRGASSHFTAIVDRGNKPDFFFVVMQLVGRSLGDLKKRQATGVLSLCCGLSQEKPLSITQPIVIQCLESIEDLHKAQFINRDIKPANFACGRGAKKRVVYILDFGIARKFTNEKGELKTPREKARFKGTMKFAAVACHKGEEQAPKDDVEQWFYLQIDLIQSRGLPWARCADREDVQKAKEAIRTNPGKAKLFEGLPCSAELATVLEYFAGLKYVDINLDYGYIYGQLAKAAETGGGTLNDIYDWEKEKETD